MIQLTRSQPKTFRWLLLPSEVCTQPQSPSQRCLSHIKPSTVSEMLSLALPLTHWLFLSPTGSFSHPLALPLTHSHSPSLTLWCTWEEWSELEIFEGGMVVCVSVLVV